VIGRRVKSNTCLPHARGGVKRSKKMLPVNYLSSPRPWGCFFWSGRTYTIKELHSLGVSLLRRPYGVDLVYAGKTFIVGRFPAIKTSQIKQQKQRLLKYLKLTHSPCRLK